MERIREQVGYRDAFALNLEDFSPEQQHEELFKIERDWRFHLISTQRLSLGIEKEF